MLCLNEMQVLGEANAIAFTYADSDHFASCVIYTSRFELQTGPPGVCLPAANALDDRTTDSIQAADLVGNSAHRYATEWSDDLTQPALDR